MLYGLYRYLVQKRKAPSPFPINQLIVTDVRFAEMNADGDVDHYLDFRYNLLKVRQKA